MKKNKNKSLKFITYLLAFIPLISYGALFSRFPERIPMHFNAAGEVNRYGDRYELLLLAVLPLAMLLLFIVLPKIDPKKENYKKFESFYEVFQFLMVALLSAVYGYVVYSAFQENVVNVSMGIFIGVGILFIILGNYMPQTKQNFMFGIRTPWTLANENVWIKTHRVGGYCFMAAGIAFILIAVLVPTEWIVVAILLAMTLDVIIPFVYSYLVYKKEEK